MNLEKINEEKFLELLASSKTNEHNDLLINFEKKITVDLRKVTLLNKFKNCKFIGKTVDFMNLSIEEEPELIHSFSFNACEFENDVSFKECSLQEIKFFNISKSVKNLSLRPKKLEYFIFECVENSEQEILNEINIDIDNCEIVKHLRFLHLKSTGDLRVVSCKINSLSIEDSKFKRIDIKHNKFLELFEFEQNVVEQSEIKANEFEKSSFLETDFGSKANFGRNDFKSTTLFQKLKNEKRAVVTFESCNFFKYVHFNKSKLYKLHIDASKFQELASFQDLELNSIYLDRTIFEKLAFFDDIEIYEFSKCTKRTLRNIKQQLLRTDNKIDYDNFRAQELNSYKKELKTKVKTKVNRKKVRRDLTILRVNSFFSNHGTDWVKAIKKTFCGAILFYSIFYVIYNYAREIDLSNTYGYSEYFIGLFRYFLLTDFHNPLINSREYLVSVWEWIPFLFGKIVIGIGIYHILVSFRKFRK